MKATLTKMEFIDAFIEQEKVGYSTAYYYWTIYKNKNREKIKK